MIERQFVDQNFKEFLIQEYIASELSRCGLSHIKLQKTPLGEKIIIHASRPGLIVGRKGANINKLTKDLKKKFEKAAADAQKLDSRPSDRDMLRMYALYKQATTGDVSGKRPGALDIRSRAKYDAWAKLKGMSKDDARSKYIDKVESLLKTHK